jgi:hypothetical protein
MRTGSSSPARRTVVAVPSPSIVGVPTATTATAVSVAAWRAAPAPVAFGPRGFKPLTLGSSLAAGGLEVRF